MLSESQKAGLLVDGIVKKVDMCPLSYKTLMDFFRGNEKLYEGIIRILDNEHRKLQASEGGPHDSVKLSPALSRYQNFLKSRYSNESIRDDKLRIAPCTRFINLAFIPEGCSDVPRNADGSINFLKLDSLVTAESRFVLVEAPPGFGKSTLCWELCRKWDSMESMQRFMVVLLLKLRDKRVQNATELNDIFSHRDKKLCQSVVDDIFQEEGDGVLFLFDGFDELPSSIVEEEDSLLVELISGKCLPKAVRVLTSRPCAAHGKTTLPEGFRHIKILGFTDDNIEQFIETSFESQPDVSDHIKAFVSSNPTVYSLMYSPINCAIVAQVFEEIMRNEVFIPKTTTQLYTALVLVLIKRHMIEKGKWSVMKRIPHDLNELPEDVLANLKRVAKLAKEIDYRQLVFSDDVVGEGFSHLGLLVEETDVFMCEGAKPSYSFIHLSMQTFLAAWHVSGNLHNTPQKLMGALIGTNLKLYTTFMAGLIGQNTITASDLAHFTKEAVYYLFEAQNSCKSLQDFEYPHHLRNKRCIAIKCSTSMDLYALGYVVANCSINWDLTLIRFQDISPLVSSLKASNGGIVLGKISKITIQSLPSHTLPNLEELPFCLFEHTSELGIKCHTIGPSVLPTSWMSSLCNLQLLSLYGVYPLENSCLLYKVIQSYSMLKRFHCTFTDLPSLQEIKDLSNCFARNHTIQDIELIYDPLQRQGFSHFDCGFSRGNIVGDYCIKRFWVHTRSRRIFELSSLVKAALSCSSLMLLSTNIPFVIFDYNSVSPNLVAIRFTFSDYIDLFQNSLNNCLCCVADMCSLPSMKSLTISYKPPDYFDRSASYPIPDEFLVILNYSLHKNSPFTWMHFDRLHLSSNYQRSTFSSSLKSHPTINRSKSINMTDIVDAADEGFDFQDSAECIFCSDSYMRDKEWNSLANFKIGKRCQSCPDLSQRKGLHGVHPVLCEALNMQVYYEEKRHDTHFMLELRKLRKRRKIDWPL